LTALPLKEAPRWCPTTHAYINIHLLGKILISVKIVTAEGRVSNTSSLMHFFSVTVKGLAKGKLGRCEIKMY
jgi:hypothetical protein